MYEDTEMKAYVFRRNLDDQGREVNEGEALALMIEEEESIHEKVRRMILSGEMRELMRRGGEPETPEEADDFYISDEEDIDPYARMGGYQSDRYEDGWEEPQPKPESKPADETPSPAEPAAE